jgi:hypothetical protein
MKKQILTLLLSLHLLFSLPLALSAEDLTSGGSTSGSTTVTAQTQAVNRPEFTLTLPDSISSDQVIDRTENHVLHDVEFFVRVGNLQYLNGKSINVSISAPGNQFLLYCGEHTLPYQVYRKGSAGSADVSLRSGDVFAVFAEGSAETQNGYVRIDSYDIDVAGEYGGVLTFTVRIADAE